MGCPIDNLTYQSAVQCVDDLVQKRRPARVGAVNAAKLLKMDTDPVLAKAVRSCEVILADGMGAVFAVLVRNGYFSREEEPAIVEDIAQSGADLVFVAMGTPAKELWIDRNFGNLGHAVLMGVGGSFDVISGEVKRAPQWMQDMGLEWFYRFIQEPRRMWRRYFITSIQFLFKVLSEKLHRLTHRGEAT